LVLESLARKGWIAEIRLQSRVAFRLAAHANVSAGALQVFSNCDEAKPQRRGGFFLNRTGTGGVFVSGAEVKATVYALKMPNFKLEIYSGLADHRTGSTSVKGSKNRPERCLKSEPL
jgi:hypothetical protein